MPSSLGVNTIKSLLDHAFGAIAYSPLSNLHAAVLTTNPSDFTSGTGAVQAAGVGRVAIANNSTNFPEAATTGLVTSKPSGSAINFGNAPADLTIVGFGFYSDSTTGNWVAGGSLTSPVIISSGLNISIEVAALTLKLATSATGGLSGYLSRKLLDLAFGAVSYTAPSSIHSAYFSTAPHYASGSGAVEPSVGGYGRAEKTNNSTNFPAATGTAIASKTCATDIEFTDPTADQGTITASGFFDAASTGNLLWSGQLTTPSTLGASTDNVRIPANTLIIGVEAA